MDKVDILDAGGTEILWALGRAIAHEFRLISEIPPSIEHFMSDSPSACAGVLQMVGCSSQ